MKKDDKISFEQFCNMIRKDKKLNEEDNKEDNKDDNKDDNKENDIEKLINKKDGKKKKNINLKGINSIIEVNED